MQKESILLVEDALSTQLIVKSLIEDICELTCVGTLNDAEKKLSAHDYNLLILDVELPDGNGFDFCKKLKAHPQWQNTPVIFLTGATDTEDRVLGFSLGAEDYVVKPLEPKEFLARIKSKLKKKPTAQIQTSYKKSNFVVDLESQRIFVINSDKTETELHLTPIEFKLLAYFIRKEGQVVSREELFTAIWGDSVHITGHTIDTHISTLRKKIAITSHRLRAVIKKGYCLELAQEDELKSSN